MRILPPTPNANWIIGLATIFMSYTCQNAFFYLRSELISKTKKRVEKVIRNATLTEGGLYLSMSIAGYLSLGSNMVPDIYTLRKALRMKLRKLTYF